MVKRKKTRKTKNNNKKIILLSSVLGILILSILIILFKGFSAETDTSVIHGENALYLNPVNRTIFIAFKLDEKNLTELEGIRVKINASVYPYDKKTADYSNSLLVLLNWKLPNQGDFKVPFWIVEYINEHNLSEAEKDYLTKTLWYQGESENAYYFPKGEIKKRSRGVFFDKTKLIKGENLLIVENGDEGNGEDDGDGMKIYSIKVYGIINGTEIPIIFIP